MKLVSILAPIVIATSAYAADIQPYRAESITPYQSQTIQRQQSDSLKPYRSESIKPYRAEEVKPQRGQEAVHGDSRGAERSQADRRDPGTNKANPASFFGVWRTSVPGAVWESPSRVPGYNKLHVSPGAAAGDLAIFPNGNYTWNSYGGKKGRWLKGDDDYPIILIDTVENKRWKVGFNGNGKSPEIVVWDGSIWYRGRK